MRGLDRVAQSLRDEVTRGFRDDIGLDHLRRDVVITCIAICLAGALGLTFVYSQPDPDQMPELVVILGLYLVAGLAFSANKSSMARGASVLIAGLLAVGVGTLWTVSLSWAIHLLPVLVLLANAFSIIPAGLLTAVTISIIMILLQSLGGPVNSEIVRTVLSLSWATLFTFWLASKPIRLDLDWAWSHYQRAEREADRARRQQGELAQLVKSLNVAQNRLEQMNHELERSRRAAEEARRLKAEFAATVSHELRTPLNLIIGFSELIASSAGSYGDQYLPPVYQRDIDTIYRNARHLSALIDDILDLSQVDAVRMGLVRERLNLADLVQEAIAPVLALFQRKGLTVTVDIPDGLPTVIGDRTRIRQILVNLLNNAARATDAGGVQISCRLVDRDLVVAVADTGIGIAPDHLPQVFEEFSQMGESPGRSTGGSGLGLTISKRFIELHGGSIWAESEPGRGSTFKFTLPLAGNVTSVPLRREWEPWAKIGSQDPGESRMVVVYDENTSSARLLQRYLDTAQVVSVSSLAEIEELQERSPLAALALTGTDVAETLKRADSVRQQFSGVPIIICPLPTTADLARDLGIADYLVKPILTDQLARVLRRDGKVIRDVLVIDDDPDMVELLVRMIQSVSEDAVIRAAYGGKEGQAAMREQRPDLVLLDLLMPDVDGYAVLQAIQTDPGLRGVSVVVVTARSGQSESIHTTSLEVTRGRPFSVAELIRLLNASVKALGESETSTAAGLPTGLLA